MSALEDAKRLLHLDGLVTADDPLDLLKRIVVEYHPRFNEQLVRENRLYKERIDELERQLQSSKAHTSYLEVALKNQIELHAGCQTPTVDSPSYKRPMSRDGRRL
jgi:hypothetical protein